MPRNKVTVCFLQDTVQKKVMWLLLMLSSFITFGDGKEEVTQLKGHFGGEVAFHCPVDEHRKLQMLYLQKGHVFVNGYYRSKDVQKHNPWPNSRVDRQRNVVYVSGVNISHSGVYTCHFNYVDDSSDFEEHMQLTITAKYSKPSLNVKNCTDKQDQCLVQCSSHGGYPKRSLKWNITGVKESRAWTIVSTNEDSDKDTALFNISSSASINCFSGKMQNISCSVDGLTTHLSICKQESASKPDSSPVIVASVCVAVIVAVAVIVMIACYKHKEIREFIRRKCGSGVI